MHRRTGRERARTLPAPARWVLSVLGWTVILGCLGALTVAVLVPRAVGATPYTILTSSMLPHLPPGTLVVDRPVGRDEVGVGSVVTYQLRSGEPEVVTHRVVQVSHSLSGRLTYRTQGDANDTVDAAPVRPVQLRGELWYAVPHLGRLNLLLSRGERQWLVYAAALGLSAYALVMFGGALQTRRRRAGPIA